MENDTLALVLLNTESCTIAVSVFCAPIVWTSCGRKENEYGGTVAEPIVSPLIEYSTFVIGNRPVAETVIVARAPTGSEAPEAGDVIDMTGIFALVWMSSYSVGTCPGAPPA